MEVRLTPEFARWISGLRNGVDRARIDARLVRVRNGNFGDHRSVGDGVSELRFKSGPGYRIYYAVRGTTIVILLTGGDKGSQSRDIVAAKALAKEY